MKKSFDLLNTLWQQIQYRYLIFISGGTLAREENEAGYPVIPKKSRTLKLSRDSQRARIMASDGES